MSKRLFAGTDLFRLADDQGVARPAEMITLSVDGSPIRAYPGETVATVLLARGVNEIRMTRDGSKRGLFCGMGACWDCLITINGRPNQRACMVFVESRMDVQTQVGRP